MFNVQTFWTSNLLFILIVTNLHHTNIGYQSHQYKNLRKHIFLGKRQTSVSLRLKIYLGPRLCEQKKNIVRKKSNYLPYNWKIIAESEQYEQKHEKLNGYSWKALLTTAGNTKLRQLIVYLDKTVSLEKKSIYC